MPTVAGAVRVANCSGFHGDRLAAAKEMVEGGPLAEIHADGSSVITKHDGTGGEVSVGTVTSQLLYEIGGPRYANPTSSVNSTRSTSPRSAAIGSSSRAPGTSPLRPR